MGTPETYRTGLGAETMAAWFLRAKGYRILDRRFKTPVGEIDLIAKRGRVVVFIEVKHRMTSEQGLYAIQPFAAARIRRAATWWLKTHPAPADKCDLRFDVIAIAPYRLIRHVSNAF